MEAELARLHATVVAGFADSVDKDRASAVYQVTIPAEAMLTLLGGEDEGWKVVADPGKLTDVPPAWTDAPPSSRHHLTRRWLRLYGIDLDHRGGVRACASACGSLRGSPDGRERGGAEQGRDG